MLQRGRYLKERGACTIDIAKQYARRSNQESGRALPMSEFREALRESGGSTTVRHTGRDFESGAAHAANGRNQPRSMASTWKTP